MYDSGVLLYYYNIIGVFLLFCSCCLLFVVVLYLVRDLLFLGGGNIYTRVVYPQTVYRVHINFLIEVPSRDMT